MVLKVDMEVRASTSKYWALLRFEDAEGNVHERRKEGERASTVNSNYLQAFIEGFRILIKPCMVTVYCGSDHIAACFQKEWVQSWEAHSWKNAKGSTVRNVEQWKELRGIMAAHSVRVVYDRRE